MWLWLWWNLSISEPFPQIKPNLKQPLMFITPWFQFFRKVITIDFSLHYPWAEDGEQQTRPYIIVPGSWKNITNPEKPPYEIRSGKSDVQYCTTQYHVNSGMLHFIIIRLK